MPATTRVPDFIHMVEVLLEKGCAYEAGGNVYFDTSKLENYYVFGNQSGEDLAVGVRDSVEEDANKRNKTDFVLWFTKSKFEDQELKWQSPWGLGYPGWHIECSAISVKELGSTWTSTAAALTTHSPTIPMKSPSLRPILAINGAIFWMHVPPPEHQFRQDEQVQRGVSSQCPCWRKRAMTPWPTAFFCLQSHYRKSLVFSWENLDNAQTAYNKLIARVAALKPGDGEVDAQAFSALKEKFTAALDNDLNSSLAVTALYDVLKAKINDETKLSAIADFDRVLSLDLIAKGEKKREELKKQAVTAGQFTIVSESGESDADVEAKIQARQDAKKAKDFAKADAIRDELKAAGIELTDIPHGVKWKRI